MYQIIVKIMHNAGRVFFSEMYVHSYMIKLKKVIVKKLVSLHKDVCGIFCAVLTWMLIFYANFVVLNVILIPFINSTYSIVNTILFMAVTTLAVASHLRTMLSDPVIN